MVEDRWSHENENGKRVVLTGIGSSEGVVHTEFDAGGPSESNSESSLDRGKTRVLKRLGRRVK